MGWEESYMGNARVMVVEDEELIRTMIKINLEKAGYDVTCSQDAESMLTALDRDPFDLVLLDIMLPGMSGEEGLAAIRQRQLKTPVIMVTAKHSIETKVSTLGSGADDYIAKPFNMQELLARVSAIIRRTKGFSG